MKYPAFGTKLYKGTSGSGVLYAHVQSFDGPDLSTDIEDVTSHDSPGSFEEVIPTIKRTGELGMSILYDPIDPTHKNAPGGLLYDYNNKTLIAVTFVFPDDANTEWTFNCYVIGFKPTAPHEGSLTADVVLKPSGVMNLA